MVNISRSFLWHVAIGGLGDPAILLMMIVDWWTWSTWDEVRTYLWARIVLTYIPIALFLTVTICKDVILKIFTFLYELVLPRFGLLILDCVELCFLKSSIQHRCSHLSYLRWKVLVWINSIVLFWYIHASTISLRITLVIVFARISHLLSLRLFWRNGGLSFVCKV